MLTHGDAVLAHKVRCAKQPNDVARQVHYSAQLTLQSHD